MSTQPHNAVRRGFYLDSVALMRLSREIAAMAGVEDAALMMATPANRRILAEAGLLSGEGEAATANDLILAVRAATAEAAAAALTAAVASLDKTRAAINTTGAHNPRSLRMALGAQSKATLALISVPGDYAAHEAKLHPSKSSSRGRGHEQCARAGLPTPDHPHPRCAGLPRHGSQSLQCRGPAPSDRVAYRHSGYRFRPA